MIKRIHQGKLSRKSSLSPFPIRFFRTLRSGSLMLPSRACHSFSASGTNLRVYALFPSPVSDRVNVDIYSLIFLRKPVADKFS
jgi:hypothetical protein